MSLPLVNLGSVNVDPLVIKVPFSEWTEGPKSFLMLCPNFGPRFPHKEVNDLIESIRPLIGEGTVSRIGFTCLSPWGELKPHVDGKCGGDLHHIPIITNPQAIFGYTEFGEQHLEKGNVYRIDETIEHYVRNGSDQYRVHLIFAI